MTIFNLSSIHVYTSKGIPLIIESAQWCGVFNPSTVLFVSKATLFFFKKRFYISEIFKLTREQLG